MTAIDGWLKPEAVFKSDVDHLRVKTLSVTGLTNPDVTPHHVGVGAAGSHRHQPN